MKAPEASGPGSALADELPALTGLRGLAAAWVLTYHAWVLSVPRVIGFEVAGLHVDLTPLFSLGWAGVQIFFVLSGFLLALPFARHAAGLGARPNVRRYLLRRVARVYPAYLVQLLVLAAAAGWAQQRFPFDAAATAGHLAMLFGPPPLGIGSSALNGVWWTLPVELSFYLVLPLLAPLLAAQRHRWLPLIGIGVMMAWRSWVVATHGDAAVPVRVLWSCQLPGSLDSFLLGMFGAALHVRAGAAGQDPGRRRRLAAAVPAALLAALALMAWMHRRYFDYWTASALFLLWTPLFSAAVLAFVLAGAARLRGVESVLGNPLVVGLGTVSYGVYLWHLPVQEWLLAHTPLGTMAGYRFPGLWAAGLALTLVLAGASWILVERRALRAAARVRCWQPAASAASGGARSGP